MTVRVNMPPGNSGFTMTGDGTHYKGKPGGHVDVEDHHAPAINRMLGNGDAGLLSAKGAHYIGTKAGRWCTECRFLANSWSVECPRCRRPTVPEPERDPVPLSVALA
jgi:hypothetical protein